ncbi:MAG: cytochrome P450 [Acidimicrobiia bacterium]
MDAPRVAPDDKDWWLDDVESTYTWLRTHDPVHQWRDGRWVVSTYDEIREVSRDPARFSSAHGVLVNDPKRAHSTERAVSAPSILEMDPPEHPRYRAIVSRAFTPRAVAEMEPHLRALTAEVLDAVPLHDEVDFVEQVAVPLPLLVIAELLGMTEVEQRQFRVWSDETIKAADGLQADLGIVSEFVAYMSEGIAAHRAEPRDDILQRLVDAEVDGQRLTDPELIVFCMSLLVAGNETTRNLISGGAIALHEHPDQRAWLAEDPRGRMRDAVEELLRWVTPIKSFARTAVHDTELAGKHIAADDYLVMLYASGNRDASAFGPTADTLDVSRAADPAHVAFGFGAHVCLGASLARLEAQVLFEDLLTRAPEYEITGEPERLLSTLMNGIEGLPAVLAPRSRVPA